VFKPLPAGSTVACDTVIGFDPKLKQAIMCNTPAVVHYKGFHLCSEHWDTMRAKPSQLTTNNHN